MFTPLPPAETGTADYAAALIGELKNLVDLHVFEKAPVGFRPQNFDAVIYQIGNNPYHAGIYETALKHPGIVVLHDANLHDLIRGLTQHHRGAYLDELTYEVFGHVAEYGEKKEAMGQQPREFTMMRRLLDNSTGCIVHSRHAEGVVRMKGFRGPVSRILHGAEVRRIDGAPYRRNLGVADTAPLLGVFGYLRPDKRVSECLAVFADLLERRPDARMLIAGQPHPEVPLQELTARLGIADKVFCLGLQPLEDVDGYLSACDVVLNLRWPTFGESSGIAARAFGLGRTVVVTDGGASRELPGDVCVRVPWDRYHHGVLLETLAWLTSDRRITDEIGAGAAKWVEDTCTWARVARRYAEFATGESSAQAEDLRGYLERWAGNEEAAQYFVAHADRLVRTVQLTPPGGAEARILEMGCYLQITPALRNVLGYGEVRGCYLGEPGTELKMTEARDGECFECRIETFDAEMQRFPYPDSHFDTVLCCELIEHLQNDPMRMMAEIHRVLKPDGVLILSTPNAVSHRAVMSALRGEHPGFYTLYPNPAGDPGANPRHAREYTPAELSRMLTDAGFLAEHIETGPYAAVSEPKILADIDKVRKLLITENFSPELRDDCLFAMGRKAAIPQNLRPSWLYDR